jgi:hypothetical protein
MTRDLIARAAAAQAAADAEAVARCVYCRATVDLTTCAGCGMTSCSDPDACRLRFVALIAPVPPSAPADAPETPGTAPHAPESSTEGT